MTALVITLLGTPRGKGRPRFSRATGRAFTPAKTVSYENELRMAAQDAIGDAPLMEGPLSITVAAWFPVPPSWSKKKRADALAGFVRPTGRPDLDNLCKMIDALNQVVFRDDSQIVDARLSKHYGDKPRLDIVIWPSPGALGSTVRDRAA